MHRRSTLLLSALLIAALIAPAACDQSSTETAEQKQPQTDSQTIPVASTDEVKTASDAQARGGAKQDKAETGDPPNPDLPPATKTAAQVDHSQRDPDWDLPVEFDPAVVAKDALEAVARMRSMSYDAARQSIDIADATKQESRTLNAQGNVKFQLMPSSDYGFRFRCTGQSWGFKNENLIIDVAFDGAVGYWLKEETKQRFTARIRNRLDLREFGGAFGLLPIELVGSDLRKTLEPDTNLIRRGRQQVGDVVCDVIVATYESLGEKVEATWLIGARDHFPRQVEQRRIPADGADPVRESFLLRITNLVLNEQFPDDAFRIETPPGFMNVSPESIRAVDQPAP